MHLPMRVQTAPPLGPRPSCPPPQLKLPQPPPRVPVWYPLAAAPPTHPTHASAAGATRGHRPFAYWIAPPPPVLPLLASSAPPHPHPTSPSPLLQPPTPPPVASELLIKYSALLKLPWVIHHLTSARTPTRSPQTESCLRKRRVTLSHCQIPTGQTLQTSIGARQLA